jgi:hypothetical protein
MKSLTKDFIQVFTIDREDSMPEEPIDKVMKAVRPFIPIGGQIRSMVEPGVADYMVALVKDDEAYLNFVDNPTESLQNQGINADIIDVDAFSQVAEGLRNRAKGGDSVFGTVATTIGEKSTSEGSQRNFDNSSSWFMNKEGYNLIYQRGTSESTTKGEAAATTKDFSGIGIREDILRHEVDLIFFPAQPLVTPALINKIRTELSEG